MYLKTHTRRAGRGEDSLLGYFNIESSCIGPMLRILFTLVLYIKHSRQWLGTVLYRSGCKWRKTMERCYFFLLLYTHAAYYHVLLRRIWEKYFDLWAVWSLFVRIKLYHKACILAFLATYMPAYISLRFFPDFSNSAYLFVKGYWLYRIFLPFKETVTQDD